MFKNQIGGINEIKPKLFCLALPVILEKWVNLKLNLKKILMISPLPPRVKKGCLKFYNTMTLILVRRRDTTAPSHCTIC